MLSITDDLGPPPAYSPHDPQTPTSDESFQPHTPISPLRPSIRGGYLSVVDDPQEVPYSSAAAYFEDRPFHSDLAVATILIEHEITPHTTRDDLPLQRLLPGHSYGMEARDVHPQDWATFVNYIITELNGSTSVRDANPEKSMSREDFQERQNSIEAVVAEWNEGFFGPRRIRFVPEFSYSAPDRPSSPTPSYRTFLTAQPAQEHASFGPSLPHLASRSPPPTLLHHRQPQALQSNVTAKPRDAPGKYWTPLGRFATAGGRGFHWRGRGRHMKGVDDGDTHHDHRWGGRGHHARSASTSSSSEDDHHSCRRRGKGHRSRSSSTSSSSADDHHGRGKGRRHRSSSTSSSSSSSSSSSNDSASSISSDELKGVEVADIRQAIANFRLDPTRKQHVKQAVRQLRSELRSHRQSVGRGGAAQSKTLKAEIRTQKRLIKSEVKSLEKEAKQYKKGLKQQRRAEKRMIKAEKRAKRRGRGLNVSSLNSYPTSMTRSFPSQLYGSCDVETGRSLNGLSQATINLQAGNFQRGLGTDSYVVNDSPRTTAYPFRPTSKYGSDSKWSNERRHLTTGENPRGSGERQPSGVAPQAQPSTTPGPRGVGVDAEEIRRRAVANSIQNEMTTERQEALEQKQEKEAGNQQRQAENRIPHPTTDTEHWRRESERLARERERDTQQRENDAELRAREAHRAAALRRKEQERAAAEREQDATMRRGLERDAARRKRDLERAAVEKTRNASQKQGGLDRAANLVGQRRTSQSARQEDLIDIGAGADASRGLARGFNTTTPLVTPRAPSSRAFLDHLGGSIGEWGTRFGRDAGEWGTRFGRDAEEWGERFGRDMEAKFS
ncbi:hypothetical protein MMC27_004861 [Xylographa pallens]|nr:hypothetical protein [Xylographa pallens]